MYDVYSINYTIYLNQKSTPTLRGVDFFMVKYKFFEEIQTPGLDSWRFM